MTRLVLAIILAGLLAFDLALLWASRQPDRDWNDDADEATFARPFVEPGPVVAIEHDEGGAITCRVVTIIEAGAR